MVLVPIYHTREIESGVTIDPETGELTLMVARNRGKAVVEVIDPFLKGYGTYEYDVQINVHDGNTTFFFGFVEEAPSNAENSVIFKCIGSNYQFETFKDGTVTRTENIAGIDLRTKGTIKLIWEAGRARLYVNGILKADHTTNVPTAKGILFAEIYRDIATVNKLVMKVENNFGREIL